MNKYNIDTTIKALNQKSRSLLPVALYLTVALIMGLLGYVYYINHSSLIYNEVGRQLQSLASLKASEIDNWFKEREKDITFYQNNKPFLGEVDTFLSSDGRNKEVLRDWLAQTQESHNYDIFIINQEKTPLYITGNDSTPLNSYIVESATEALKVKKSIFLDIYRQIGTDKLFFSNVAPIMLPGEQTPHVSLLFRSNVRNNLLQYVQRSPSYSQSAEFAIVGNDGDSVYFVNDKKYTDLSKLHSNSNEDPDNAPFIQAARGRTGIFKGENNTGTEVLAYITNIPGSEWALVSSLEVQDIEKQLMTKKLQILALILLSLAIFILWHFIFVQKTKNKHLNEQLRLNDQLVQNREILQSIIQTSPLPIVVISESNIINIWNKAAAQTFGWKIEEISEVKNPIFDESNILEFQQIIEYYRNHIDTYTFQTTRQRKDGTIMELQCWVSNLIDSVDNASNLLFIFEDITLRKKNENEIIKLNESLEQRVRERTIKLQELNELLEEEIDTRTRSEQAAKRYAIEVEDLYNNAPCGYHSLDDAGVFVRVNDTELKWLGYPREDLVGKKRFTDFLSKDSIEIFNKNFPILKEKGKVTELEFEVICLDGSIKYVLLSSFAIFDEHGRFKKSRSTLFDISEIKQTRQEVEALNHSLIERANQLELVNKELESFTYSVSHDLKAPLRSIEGFTSMILTEHSQELSEDANRLFAIIQRNTKRMDQLIKDLLDLAHVTRLDIKLNPIDMAKLIKNVMDNDFTNANTGKVKLEVPNLPKALGDTVLIQQVWYNLLSNAIKYSRTQSDPTITINSNLRNGYVEYSVKDNGVGFNPEYMHKLFGAFQRLHPSNEFEGSGVGLAIVKRIINRHGGEVWAESQEGKGATFHFTLPKA